jgi:hypothetical protein
MNIVLLQHHEIDKARWDAAIDRSPHGLIYACSWFLDIASPGWCALMSDDYRCVMPLPVRTKWKLPYVYPPFFIQQLGIFSDEEVIRPEVSSAFLNKVKEHYRFAELYLHEKCMVKAGAGFLIRNQRNHVLPLHKSYEEIRAAYSSQLKRNLKKAGSAGTVIRPMTTVTEIINLFRKSASGKNSNYRSEDYVRFEKLMEACYRHQKAAVSGTFDTDDKLLGGAVFLKSRHRITFVFSGMTDYARQHSLLALLLDDVIRKNCDSNLVFDFEGSMDKGLARFYKSFGSLESVYTFVKLNRLPKIIKWLK